MSLGPTIRITYHVPDDERSRVVDIAGDGSLASREDPTELGITVSGDTEVRRVAVRPSAAVRLDSVVATMSVALKDADALYLNGYNSWTDSIERAVDDRMVGLTRVPRRLIDQYVLDASGDYRFVDEDPRPGHQHGFSYGYLRQADEVLFFGSIDEDLGYTVIREDLDASTLTFDKEVPARVIGAGEEREILGLVVLGGRLEDCVDRWLALSGKTLREAAPLCGYSSWYRHYGDIDFWKLAQDLGGVAKVLGSTELGGVEGVFQIDDGYAKVGDWLEYDRSRFVDGLRGLAQAASSHGLVPGLWLAPFVCEYNSRTYCEHPDWLLRDSDGEPVTTGSQWSGAVALDIQNEQVRAYVSKALRTVTQDWGFKLLKLDFLYAACLEPHAGLNRGELMADALELLRSSVADGTRLLLCGVPLVSAMGRCEYCRIGPDVGLDWDDKPHMRLLHRERVSTKWSLANARGRAHLDGRAFRCDPDILFLRTEGVSFTPHQREEMLHTDTSCGGVLFTSDDMGAWDEAQLIKFQEAVKLFRAYNEV